MISCSIDKFSFALKVIVILEDIERMSLANLSSMFMMIAENWMTGSQLCRFGE